MGIVYQTDKRSGITYAYENKAYWDKEKKQSRSKRTLIGRVDPETGKIIPTDGRCKKRSPSHQDESAYIETCVRNGVNEFQALLRLTRNNPYTLQELFSAGD